VRLGGVWLGLVANVSGKRQLCGEPCGIAGTVYEARRKACS
jgi:hypothetical protein